jgi:hypothetical protein
MALGKQAKILTEGTEGAEERQEGTCEDSKREAHREAGKSRQEVDKLR